VTSEEDLAGFVERRKGWFLWLGRKHGAGAEQSA
jgi:hypothetical protein